MVTPDQFEPAGVSRRDLLVAGAAMTLTACVRSSTVPLAPQPDTTASQGAADMPTIITKDGTNIFYKDWGNGPAIVFSHGWPLSADAWDEQLLYFASRGFRAIAHDRRGHGRSGQSWNGNDMDTYADDLATLIEKLQLQHIVLVGHSSGGGEVARYLGRHGNGRVAKAVLASAIPPLMLKTAANPGGLPLAVFDGIRAGVSTNRSQFYQDASAPFLGTNRPGSTVPQGLRDQFWLQSMQCGLRGAHECIRAFSETDFTEDLKRIDVPTLVLHGADDQYVPVDNHAPLTAKLVKRSTLKIYPGGPHGLPMARADEFNADVMGFVQG
jgi:non-heme chloroperoxidase